MPVASLPFLSHHLVQSRRYLGFCCHCRTASSPMLRKLRMMHTILALMVFK